MRVVAADASSALVEADGEIRRVSTLLLDRVAEGDFVLVHATNAVRVIDAEEARLVTDALHAVMAAARGETFEHLVADLIDREPELPPHLRA